MVLIVPGPDDTPGWEANTASMNATLEKLAPRCSFNANAKKKKKDEWKKKKQVRRKAGLSGEPSDVEEVELDPPKGSRRGIFHCLSYGLSYGNGQSRPKVINQETCDLAVLNEIRNDEAFKRLAGFINGNAPIST